MADSYSNETGVSPQHELPLRDESLKAISEWFDALEKRVGVDKIVSRTTLQAGIHNDVVLDYAPGRTSISSESKSDADGLSPGSRKGELSVAQIEEYVVLALTQAIALRVQKLADTAVIDYRFCFRAVLPAIEGRLLVTLFTFTNEVNVNSSYLSLFTSISSSILLMAMRRLRRCKLSFWLATCLMYSFSPRRISIGS
ncbi:DUF6138 family protein [Pectobacterium atrosepticum]|nr:DUF6138 family protein [Pectobacterium atrosepticum]